MALGLTRRQSGWTVSGASSSTAASECGWLAASAKLSSTSKWISPLVDVITPERKEENYPTLLDLPVPHLWTYPRETVVAEKLEAMVRLGAANSRAKDLWDIACLARRFAFDGETLRTAIAETFRRRRTSLSGARPLVLLPSYCEDTTRAQRWQVLQRQVGPGADGPARLVDAGEELRRFIGPVWDGLMEGSPFTEDWPAGGPWRPGIQVRTEDERQ